MGQENGGNGINLRDSYFQKRREEKYEMQVGAAAFVRHEIERHLPIFEYRKGYPYTYITTIYFDTEKLDLYQTARDFYDDDIKVRVKEYYYQSPTCQRNGIREHTAGPWITYDDCFLEIKQRIRGLVLKKRLKVPKQLFGRLLRGEDIWENLVASRPGIEFDGMLGTYREFRRYLQFHRVLPKVIIGYRRRAYQAYQEDHPELQHDQNDLRITLDDEQTVFEPVAGLYESAPNLTRDQLGVPKTVLEKVTLEIKCQEAYPEWLERLLRTHEEKRISKFTSSLGALNHEILRQDSSETSKTYLLAEHRETNGNGALASDIQS